MKTIKHEELKGGYSMGNKIIVDACQLSENEFDIMALYENGEELENKTVITEIEATKAFNEMINKYAEPLQKAIYNANLVEGKKYTLLYCNEFGFPVAQKITFHSIKLTTYAQYSDVVEMIYTPYRKRNAYKKYIYNKSIIIVEGWQDLKEEDTKTVLEDNETVKTTISKYSCFDSRYIEDMEKIFKNPIVIYKDYKTGVNGKIYA